MAYMEHLGFASMAFVFRTRRWLACVVLFRHGEAYLGYLSELNKKWGDPGPAWFSRLMLEGLLGMPAW